MIREILSTKQTDMMKHAYGYYSKKPGFRSHYCTELDDPHMVDMVNKGYFSGPTGIGSVGEGYGIFHLTDAGITELKDIQAMEGPMRSRLIGKRL